MTSQRRPTPIPTALPRHVRTTDAAVGAGAILEPGVNLWLWRRQLDPAVIDVASAATSRAPHSARRVCAIDDRHAAVEELLDAHAAPATPARTRLAQDMASLAFLFARLSGLARVQVRMDAAVEEACPLFHVDSVPLRLLCTYVGAGTEWLADDDADLDEDAIRADLDACLLTDAELALGEHGWSALPDPFPAWPGMEIPETAEAH